jgi:hypothetical protein
MPGAKIGLDRPIRNLVRIWYDPVNAQWEIRGFVRLRTLNSSDGLAV